MRSDRGMSLAEVTVVMVVVAIIATAAATYTIPWLGREEMRGAVYQVQQYLQLARVDAISRNRSCRFQIDTSSRRMTVIDLNDPASTTDDILLNDARLHPRRGSPGAGASLRRSRGGGADVHLRHEGDGRGGRHGIGRSRRRRS